MTIQLLLGSVTALVLKMAGYEELATSPYALMTTMTVSSLIVIGLFVYAGWAKVSRAWLLSHPWVVLMWVVPLAMGTVVPSAAVQELMPDLPNLIDEQMAGILNARGGYFVICLLGPLAEELVFRGAVLRALLSWKAGRPWAMIALSALFFAGVHFNPAQMPHAFLMGLLLGWLYCRTGSIVPGVVFHWVNNTIAYILFKLYPDPDIQLVDMFGSQQRVLLAIGFSLLILLPSLWQLHLNMKQNAS
jgi:hypothetical protein